MTRVLMLSVNVRNKLILQLIIFSLKVLVSRKMEKIFKGTEKVRNKFIRSGLKTANPNNSAGVAAKTKNPQAGKVTSNISKTLTDGRVVNITDLHGNGL